MALVVAVVAAGVVPFYLAAPVDTVRAMTAVYVAGVTAREDAHRSSGCSTSWRRPKLEIARDAPIVLAAVLVVWARWRARRRAPGAGTARRPLPWRAWPRGSCSRSRSSTTTSWPWRWPCCSSTSSAGDCRCGRWRWIVATRFVLTPLAPHVPLTLTAALFLLAALVPIGLGLAQVRRARPPPVPVVLR